MTRRAACRFGVFVLVAAVVPTQALGRGEVREWKRSVGTVISVVPGGIGSGTGFVIDTAGHVVTNHHVIDGAKSIEFFFTALDKTSATVVAADEKLDLAVLKLAKLDASLHPPLPVFAGARVEDGDEVYAIGFPGTDAMYKGKSVLDLVASRGEPSARDGKVTKVTRDPTGREVIQTSADITHGNSGGPLVDACGSVVGVNTFLHCDPSRPWDCAKFAVGHGELLRFLSTTGAAVTKVASNCVPTVPTDWKLIAAAAVAGVLGLAGLVVGLRRQSRDAVVQYVSRSFGRRDRGEKVARDHGQKVVQPPPPPPPSVATYLVGLAGPLAGAEIPLGPEPIFVGRDPKVANVVLPEDTHGVSRRHLEVVFKDGHVQVRDSWSTQGTRVGGRKVEPGGWITVAPGDRIELGGPGVQFGIRS